jgi:hypothetical protein
MRARFAEPVAQAGGLSEVWLGITFIGLGIAAATTSAIEAFRHAKQVEVTFLHAGHAVSQSEPRAVNGTWPSTTRVVASGYHADRIGTYVLNADLSSDGGVTYEFISTPLDAAPRRPRDRITVRPAVAPVSGAVSWLCAGATPPPSYEIQSRDFTTLQPEGLMSPCRPRNLPPELQ